MALVIYKDPGTCSICIENLKYNVYSPNDEQTYITKCNHKFHHKCIYDWYVQSVHHSCPLCRSRIYIDNWQIPRSIMYNEPTNPYDLADVRRNPQQYERPITYDYMSMEYMLSAFHFLEMYDGSATLRYST
jgi:hypothetical protein